VNVNTLLSNAKRLRFSPRGDRLAQFMGRPAADEFMNALTAAQQAGVDAVKTQNIAKVVLHYLPYAAGAAGTAGALYEFLKQPTTP
jgi:hypothetical protein